MSDELTPITRKETFLAKAGGQNVVTPTPITREETFLQAIIDNGSGGGGGGGGALIATLNMQTGALDKTWNEINNATLAIIKITEDANITCYVMGISNVESDYHIFALTAIPDLSPHILQFDADSADGYPVLNMG